MITDLAASLLEKSGFEVSPEGDLASPDKTLSVERITDPEDPRIKKVYEFTLKEYGEDEATEEDWLRRSVARPENPDHLEVARGSEGLESYIHSEVLSAKDKRLLYLCYTIPDEDSPETLAMLSRVYNNFAGQLKPGEKPMVSIEAGADMEPQCNEAGLRRIYYRDDQGKIQEIQYRAPEIAFDKNDVGRFQKVPNHLMWWSGGSITPDELVDGVAAMYEMFWKYDEFDSEAARERAHMNVEKLLDSFRQEVAGKELLFLSAAEREAFIEKGEKVIDWDKGD